jgi:hypothetical protein
MTTVATGKKKALELQWSAREISFVDVGGCKAIALSFMLAQSNPYSVTFWC